MNLKQSDQLALLKACAVFTDTCEWKGLFVYPGCGWDLVSCGLATEDRKITTAGRAALFLACDGVDPTSTQTSVTFSIPMDTDRPTEDV